MCKDAAHTAGELMQAVEPELVEFLTVLGVASTPDGQAAIVAYNAADQAVINYVPGTGAQDTVQIINAFDKVFDTLPVPTEAKGLADAIDAAIVVVIGILVANAPAPPPPAGVEVSASADEIQHAHANEIARDTEAKVEHLVPGFKRSKFHSVTHQWKNAWKKQAEEAAKADPKYAVLVH